MKIYFDTEFIDDGRTVELLSIGMVREDGATYYAEAEWTDKSRACEWVQKNVLPHLTGMIRSKKQMKIEILEFCGPHPEFWGYFADYDWVVLCQLFGRMMDLPQHWPMYCNDIQQIRVAKGVRELPKQGSIAHNALNDAVWTMQVHGFLTAIKPADGAKERGGE